MVPQVGMVLISEAIKIPSRTDHSDIYWDLAYWLVAILVSKELKQKHKCKDGLFQEQCYNEKGQ